MNACTRLLPIAIVLLALAARLLPGPRTIDDAYITFRYARNLLAGEGFVYNAGERVLGTTTPLYGGLMAGIGLFTGGADAPFPEIALAANAIFDALTCLLFLHLGRQLDRPLAGTGAALTWAILPFSVTFAIGGMETSLFVLLLTGLAAAHLEGRRVLTAFLAALALLTRPDAALLVLPIGIDRLASFRIIRGTGSCPPESAHKGRCYVFSDRFLFQLRNTKYAIRTLLPELTAFLLPLLLWLIPATLYYGSPIPGSISAKSAAYLVPADAAFTRLTQHYATPFMDNLTLGIAGIGLGVVLYPFLSLIAIRRYPRLWPWLAFPWLWYAAYVIAHPLIFRWYLTPPLPAYIFGIFLGMETILGDLQLSRGSRSRWVRAATVGLILIPVGLTLRGWALSPDHGLTRPAPDMAWYALELKYRAAAEYLAPIIAASPQPVVVAAGDIGTLGYLLPAKILDTLGLISPEAIPYYPTRPEYHANAYAVAPDLIADLQPDYVVLLEVYGRLGLFKDARFQAQYELVHVVETDIYDSAGMLIFERKQAVP